MDLKTTLVEELERVRKRSLDLLDPIPEADQLRQVSPIMSPLVWDLAHVGNFEELWLLRTVAGLPTTNPDYDDIYNPFLHGRDVRPSLKLLGPGKAREYIHEVRGRVLDVMEDVEFDPKIPLLADGYIYQMVIQHEHQHDETMLATLQLMGGESRPPSGVTEPPPEVTTLLPAEVTIPGTSFQMGTDVEPYAYDNERPAHVVEVSPFRIDTAPVTNGEFIRFIEAGGYDDERLWDPKGWTHRKEARLAHPEFWVPKGGGTWGRMRYGRLEGLPVNEPVQHVCWYEADAYARWAGKRLPTEAEWEIAASWSADGTKRRFPWGDDDPSEATANLGQRHAGPAPVGVYPGGASPWGCHQMIGDVWEWTSSDFDPYPGFAAFPYKEYSEVFYGPEYKVLRGGSWATHPSVIRNTFRNWDFPIRRQIFAGFRCARDA